MSVVHGGMVMTMERNKHMVAIEDGGIDDGRGHGHGRDQRTQELAMTSDVD